MKFEEALQALRDGKKIGRKKWNKGYYYRMTYKYGHNVIIDNYDEAKEDWENLLADDWEIVEEKKKVKLRNLTEEEYKTFIISKCRNQGCDECLLKDVSCQRWSDKCWINHKDLYSDKFLDQEIEIEE